MVDSWVILDLCRQCHVPRWAHWGLGPVTEDQVQEDSSVYFDHD